MTALCASAATGVDQGLQSVASKTLKGKMYF